MSHETTCRRVLVGKRGVVYVTKVAAAQRQLDAAIRMTLVDEDALAIHTVAAAAYRILRDIKKQRNHRELNERLGTGLFHLARDLVSGEIEELPEQVRKASPLFSKLVDHVVFLIRNGKITSPKDVFAMLRFTGEESYWRQFNQSANFLKHADIDVNNRLREGALDNNTLLLSAVCAYSELMGTITPEMQSIAYYLLGDTTEFRPRGWTDSDAKQFRAFSPGQRRKYCAALLEDTRDLQEAMHGC
jgi:hypothetical protein